MTIAIIGATGKLGALTIEALLDRDAPAGDILALGRNADRLAELTVRSLRTATLDLDDVDATAKTLTGVDKLLLVSFGPGDRVPQHVHAIDAARQAGVPHLVYTSGLQAPTTILELAADHKATEELITASGIPATFLRNGWYTENHLQDFATARERGVIANSIGTGRIAPTPRKDFAKAAAVVLSTPGHEGKAYELSGDVAWSFEEFAATAAEVLGTEVRYQPLTSEQEREQLLAFGLDEATAGFLVTLNTSMRDGAMPPPPVTCPGSSAARPSRWPPPSRPGSDRPACSTGRGGRTALACSSSGLEQCLILSGSPGSSPHVGAAFV
ncbi:NAD(P)H-binding protein [Streptomyces altiplanensis]